jgi:phosphatidylglycerophosphate synthase
MESISELRKLCQSTRPSVYTDFLSTAYYRVAIYFTWICIKLNLSANQVTVLSGFFALVGGVLLGSDSKWLILLSAVCFHLFAILDMSDGEVARYRNQGGVTGHFLDWYMHFISSTAFVIGLFMASLDYLQSFSVTLIALVAVVIPILDKSVQNAGWTVICWTRLRDINNNSKGFCEEGKQVEMNPSDGNHTSWIVRRLRFMLLAPLMDHWIPLIFLLVALVDVFIPFSSLGLPDYRFIWLMFFGLVGPVNVFLSVRHLVQTQSLQDGYQRITCPSRKMKFPEDDFLG